MKSSDDLNRIIDKQFDRNDLTSQDILTLVIAKRLIGTSDNTFAQAVGGLTINNR